MSAYIDWGKRCILDMVSAHRYFLDFGCSHFHMSRDYPERYEEYCALRVSRAVEVAWRRSAFDDECEKLLTGHYLPEEQWAQHSAIARLAKDLGEVEATRKLVEVTRRMAPTVPRSTRFLVAETLVGRSRSHIGSDGVLLL